MRPYRVCKKQFNLLILFVFLIALSAPAVFSHAQTVADVQAQIDQRNSDINQLEQEITSYQNQLDVIGQQKNSLSSSLKELDLNKKKLNANIQVIENKIANTNLTIKNLSSDIGDKQIAISNNIDSVELDLRETNELEQGSLLEKMLSGEDFSTIWKDINDLASVRDRLKNDVTDLLVTKGSLENTRQSTIDAKNKLISLESELSDQKKIVQQNINDKNTLLKQTKNSEANYQQLLASRLAQKEAVEKELENYESQLQFTLNPTELPTGKVLSWPLVKIYVTQFFGKTEDAKRLYVSGSHDGVDFRASIGTPVLSMADGTVMGTGNTDLTCPGASFGKFVFIKYNDGLASAYGHLSLIKVSVGQKVSRGDVVGYSGSTGYVTGPHLHVSLYVASAVKMATMPSKACTGKIYTMPIAPLNAYLDPMVYLPPYTAKTTIYNTDQQD